MSRNKRPWLCKHNHALLRSATGTIVCFLCARYVNSWRYRDKPMGVCHQGHGRPVGARTCQTCDDWRATPWHKELDLHGVAQCPNGHWVTPTEGILYTKGHRRLCLQCVSEWSSLGREKYTAKVAGDFVRHGRNGLCAAGKHPWGPGTFGTKVTAAGKKVHHCYQCRRDYYNARNWRTKIAKENERELEPHFIDWVVANRLIAEGSEGLVRLRRGKTYGPTLGEKWIVYSTWKLLNGREPLLDYAALPERAIAIWGAEGRAAGFTVEMDIYKLIGSLGDKAYLDGTLLFGG